MSLLYLAGSLAGIALLVLLNRVLFGRAKPDVGSAEAIAAHLAREIPGFRAGRCALGTDGLAALIENDADRSILLVQALGEGIVTRRLSRALLASTGRLGARLSLGLSDFTLPRVRVALASESLAREWETRLKA
jgi:hypothetical protein